ncbi:MAG: hypothetical protein K6A65_08260, partial [Succinivibrionaceae bacterium]|nr:hypothetical protein [Succinivibrionaceae bacterium]
MDMDQELGGATLGKRELARLRGLAREGDTAARRELAYAYAYNPEIASPKRALRLLRDLLREDPTHAGDALAFASLKIDEAARTGRPKSLEEAHRALRRAAAGGDVKARLNLANFLINPEGEALLGPQALAQGAEILAALDAEGVADGSAMLADAIITRNALGGDPDLALKYAARAPGNDSATLATARVLSNPGDPAHYDYERAKGLLEGALGSDSPSTVRTALDCLAWLIREHGPDEGRRAEEALPYMQRLATLGSREWQVQLGCDLIMLGERERGLAALDEAALPEDYRQDRPFRTTALCLAAQERLSVLATGEVESRPRAELMEERAMNDLTEAMRLGSAAAAEILMRNYAREIEGRTLLTLNPLACHACARRGMELGSAYSALGLGLLYERGAGCERSPRKAVRAFMAAL